MKKELVESILEELSEVMIITGKKKKDFEEAISRALQGREVIKTTGINYCQSCGRDFKSKEVVYYAPIDNNIVCEKCSRVHEDRELRVTR